MNRCPRIPISETAKRALADIAGEALAGLGFEDEMPDSDLTESGQLFPGAPAKPIGRPAAAFQKSVSTAPKGQLPTCNLPPLRQ
jgi:hypothetical protein